MTPVVAPYRSGQQAGRDGFPQLLRAEWTKFRTVRGWVTGMVAAALMVVLFAVLAGISSDQHGTLAVPVGPGGEPVTDSFYFVHRPLAGNGSITVSVSALRDYCPRGLQPGIVPWAKAGLIIKASTRQGSPYAAIMVTSSHGVRMQYDYIRRHGRAPRPCFRRVCLAGCGWTAPATRSPAMTPPTARTGPRWAPFTWPGLGPAVQGGLFVASPDSVQGFGTDTSVSTAVFGNLAYPGKLARW